MKTVFSLLILLVMSPAMALLQGDRLDCRNEQQRLFATHQIGGSILNGSSEGQPFSMKCIPFSKDNFKKSNLELFQSRGLKAIIDHCGFMGDYAYIGLISQKGKQTSLNVFVFNFEGDFIGEQSAICQKVN